MLEQTLAGIGGIALERDIILRVHPDGESIRGNVDTDVTRC